MALGGKFSLENLLKMLQGGKLILKYSIHFQKENDALEPICVFQQQITQFRAQTFEIGLFG